MFLSFLVIVLSCVARTLTRARISDVLLIWFKKRTAYHQIVFADKRFTHGVSNGWWSVTVFAKTRFTWEPQQTDSYAGWESNTSTAPCNQLSQSAGREWRESIALHHCRGGNIIVPCRKRRHLTLTRESSRERPTLRCEAPRHALRSHLLYHAGQSSSTQRVLNATSLHSRLDNLFGPRTCIPARGRRSTLKE